MEVSTTCWRYSAAVLTLTMLQSLKRLTLQWHHHKVE
jgi:hypothetical protein